MCWLLVEFLKVAWHMERQPIFLAFLDAETAFCRPPPDVVLRTLKRITGVSEHTWAAIQAFPKSLYGIACIRGKLRGFLL